MKECKNNLIRIYNLKLKILNLEFGYGGNTIKQANKAWSGFEREIESLLKIKGSGWG